MPFRQMGSSTSWYVYLLTYLLTFSLSLILWQKVGKSINNDCRTLKFCMWHPWTHSLKLRKNQIFFYVCQSVSWRTSFLKLRQIYGYLQFLMRDLSDFFWKHSWDFVKLVTNFSEFPLCLSGCLLAYFLTERAKFL